MEDADFKYDIYLFGRPAVWKWNQELTSREKFVVGTYTKEMSDLSEQVEVTIRKTEEFTTLNISRGDYGKDGSSPQMVEYTLDENGQIKHVEKMDKEYYEIYTKLQSDIKEAVKKMDTIYSTLYA